MLALPPYIPGLSIHQRHPNLNHSQIACLSSPPNPGAPPTPTPGKEISYFHTNERRMCWGPWPLFC